MRLNSLAFRLFITAAAWTLLVLPLAGILISSRYRDDVQATFDDRLKTLVQAAAADSMAPSGTDEPIAPINRYEPLFEVTHSGWYWQIQPVENGRGTRLVSASLATAQLPSPYDRKFPHDVTGTRWMNVPGPVGEPIRIIEVIDTPGHEDDGQKYSIIVAGPIDNIEERVKEFRSWLMTPLALAGLGLLAVTMFQVQFGLLPLRRIEKDLAAVRSGAATKLEGELPAEIEPLQNELNALIESNQEIVDRARTQVGNLAHALKTPLAVITNEAREEKGALGAKVAEQAQVMRDSIARYLDRARIAARVGVIGRSTEVEPVLEALVRALERLYRDKDVSITAVSSPNARFQGEKHDLEEMLGNLLDNACKWAKGRVYVAAEVSQRESRVGRRQLVLTVDDDGPGLTVDQRAQIGKRGMRLDETKPGSGLGLSIVTELVQSYRGEIELLPSERGGLRVRLELPAA